MKKSSFVLIPLLLASALPAAAQSWRSGDGDNYRNEIGFGTAVAVGGGEVFISEPQNFYSSGLVYIYREVDGEWRESGRITADEGEAADGFGSQIALDGNTLLVSAGGGKVYVFERSSPAEEWNQAALLEAEDVADGDGFGVNVAVSGEYAIVGAHSQAEFNGAAYVFRRDSDGRWSEVQKITPAEPEEGERFGVRVAISGGRAIVSATRHGDGQGAVYGFGLDEETGAWEELGLLTVDGLGENDRFGSAIDLEGNRALIGTYRNNRFVGVAHLFTFDDESGEWSDALEINAFDQENFSQFGTSVALAGSDILIGAPGAFQFNGGAYLVIGSSDEGWSGVEKITADDLLRGDRFGSSVAASDDIAVISIGNDDYGAGSAVIYQRSDSGWWPAGRIMSELEVINFAVEDEVECKDGSASAFGCNAIDLVSVLPVQDMGGTRGVKLNDIWGWTDSTTGHDYAIVGRVDGTSFVDITDPVHPRYLGDLPMTEGTRGNSWRDIKVYRSHAFIVADGAGDHGMQVFDLTQLRDVSGAPVTFTETAHYDLIGNSHNIVINEQTGFAYAVGVNGSGETCGGGLHMINIENPINPTFAGCFADPETGRSGTGYSHDAQCVVYRGPDSDYAGREICFASNETALSIADVTDKDNPVAISRATYPNVSYAHQGWITEDHRYFLTDDEGDEIAGLVENTRTLVWDITDLDDPVLATEYFASISSTDHNLYINGDRVYQSNNTGGLRVLDISDPTNPVEVGYFDTFPSGDDGPGYHGTWSNYPFFESGLIIATGRREGLFILREQRELTP
ncbi:MAG: choice-of-anchor B family protein [Gemmatimonadetes bacterium]|nr:choice-of-anchor B family protein [Gemmatimonadota bacterium]